MLLGTATGDVGAYEARLRPPRRRFASNASLHEILSPAIEPALLELFLLHFCVLGVGITECIESWSRRAGERSRALSLDEVGRLLGERAQSAGQRHRRLLHDASGLVARWNTRFRGLLDARRLLGQPPSPGVLRYRKLQEAIVTGPAPFAELAIACEIERVLSRHGSDFVRNCILRLGPEIVECLHFLEDDVAMDVALGRAITNQREIERLIAVDPDRLGPLVQAGTVALDAYAAFLDDCLSFATVRAQRLRA